jgi:hypothetical protein
MIVFAVFAVKTAFLLGISAEIGRLAMPAVYDDIQYFHTAVVYLDGLRRNGVIGLMEAAYYSPPHSPGSTLIALSGFALTGAARWSAYAMNAVAVYLVFLAATWRWQAMLVLAVGLTFAAIPLFEWIVTTFHPDLIAGLMIGAACLLLVSGRFAEKRIGDVLLIGALMAGAALMKPVSVAMLGIQFSVALAGTVVLARLDNGSWARIGRNLLILLAAAVAFGGWFILARLPAIIAYIFLGFVEQRDVWFVAMTPWQHARFYVDLLAQVFGIMWWPGVLLLGVAAIVFFMRNRDAFRRLLLLIALCTVAWAVPSVITSPKTFFFGGVLYGMAFWTTAYAAVGLYDSARTPESVKRVALAAAVLLAVVGMRSVQNVFPREALDQANAIADAMVEEIAGRKQPITKVLLPFPLPVPSATFDYRLRLHGQEVRHKEFVQEGRLNTLLNELAEADIVGLPDRAGAIQGTPFPVMAHLDALIEAARTSHDFKLLRTIPVTGGNYYIFAKGPALYVQLGQGWGPPEGPYPQWNVGLVRWSSQRSNLNVGGAGAGHLHFTCRLPAGAHATLTTPDGTATLRGTGNFEKVSLPVKSGDTLTIRVEGADSPDRALLCQELPIFGW